MYRYEYTNVNFSWIIDQHLKRFGSGREGGEAEPLLEEYLRQSIDHIYRHHSPYTLILTHRGGSGGGGDREGRQRKKGK